VAWPRSLVEVDHFGLRSCAIDAQPQSAESLAHVVKIGRTHLMDATPLTVL
jgi:fumarate hydratase class II